MENSNITISVGKAVKFDIRKTNAITCDVKEIHQLILQSVAWPVRASWGVDGWTNYDNLALRFRVRGHHHKGYVYVILNGLDLFEVHLVSLQGNVKKVISDLYGDQLGEAIDIAVERIADYKH